LDLRKTPLSSSRIGSDRTIESPHGWLSQNPSGFASEKNGGDQNIRIQNDFEHLFLLLSAVGCDFSFDIGLGNPLLGSVHFAEIKYLLPPALSINVPARRLPNELDRDRILPRQLIYLLRRSSLKEIFTVLDFIFPPYRYNIYNLCILSDVFRPSPSPANETTPHQPDDPFFSEGSRHFTE
jgi:hypothetical protein